MAASCRDLQQLAAGESSSGALPAAPGPHRRCVAETLPEWAGPGRDAHALHLVSMILRRRVPRQRCQLSAVAAAASTAPRPTHPPTHPYVFKQVGD